MKIPEGMEVVALAEPGDTVVFRMPPEATREQHQQANMLLAPMAEERGLKFVLVSGNIRVQNRGWRVEEYESKYFVMGDWLVVEADGCTCCGDRVMGHESHCGVEPVASIEQIEKWFSRNTTARYEEALRWLVRALDADLATDLEDGRYTHGSKDAFPQLARDFENRVNSDEV